MADHPSLEIELLPHAEGLPLPRYQTEESSGLDLHAAVETPVTLAFGERALIPTGLKIGIPAGHEGQVRPRSGLALRNGLTLLNSPGTIDRDYTGELKVILANLGQEPFTVERGARIAQLVIAPVTHVAVKTVVALNETTRGAGGFGHTGV